MFFWQHKPASSRPIPEKIEVFSRHCLFSTISQHKKRFSNFSREKCFDQLIRTIDPKKANVTFILDTANGKVEDHFLFRKSVPIVQIEQGSEAGAFLALLDYIIAQPLSPDTVVYIVEDDYLHREGWLETLREGFSLPVDYVTLYDHRDKYFSPMYRHLYSKIFVTSTCHWRTVPSTTNTFATRFSTLLSDLSTHQRFSRNRLISDDHRKFCCLGRKGRILISPMPGWSTHAEPDFASPCIDWTHTF